MALRHLPAEDLSVVQRCLIYVLESGELEGEFQTRMGVTETEVRRLLDHWPADDTSDDSVACLAINNALNEVCHGIRIPDDEWTKWFAFSRRTVEDVYDRWATGRGWTRTDIR